jgi:uroporphyrinogen decarboxylase
VSEHYRSDLFLRACRGEPVDATPVWVMRQAGRYLPEYRAVRSKASFSEMLHRPELAAEVTLQPVRRFELDAAIIFADILTVTEAMGVPFEIVKGRGPVMERAIRTREDVRGLRDIDPVVDAAALLEAIRMVVRELDGRIPLIGFSGAPFTLACYLVEGGPSKDFTAMRALCYRAPDVAQELMTRIGDAVIRLLHAQVDAGVEALQLFDTWASVLGPRTYRELALPAARRVLDAVASRGVPRIFYAGSTGLHRHALAGCGADVLGVDWRTELRAVAEAVGHGAKLQGNLDPCALYAPPEVLREEIERVLRDAEGLAGHVFNLGHGIHPDVDPGQVGLLVDTVHERTRR